MNRLERNVFRVVDANLNRSREGLRVCEDITRYILDSAALTNQLRIIRHRISAVASQMARENPLLLDSRDARDDVGGPAVSRLMMPRRRFEDIMTANLERVKESLRVLEEFCRIIDEKLSPKFARLRFKLYDVEKEVYKKLKKAS